MVLGPFSFLKTPVSNDWSSAVRLWGTPPSRITTVTLPGLVGSGVGLNLNDWMAIVCSPAAADVLGPLDVPVEAPVVTDVAAVVGREDFLLLSSDPHAPTARTATATSAGASRRRERVGIGTSGLDIQPGGRRRTRQCCGDRRTAGG